MLLKAKNAVILNNVFLITRECNETSIAGSQKELTHSLARFFKILHIW